MKIFLVILPLIISAIAYILANQHSNVDEIVITVATLAIGYFVELLLIAYKLSDEFLSLKKEVLGIINIKNYDSRFVQAVNDYLSGHKKQLENINNGRVECGSENIHLEQYRRFFELAKSSGNIMKATSLVSMHYFERKDIQFSSRAISQDYISKDGKIIRIFIVDQNDFEKNKNIRNEIAKQIQIGVDALVCYSGNLTTAHKRDFIIDISSKVCLESFIDENKKVWRSYLTVNNETFNELNRIFKIIETNSFKPDIITLLDKKG